MSDSDSGRLRRAVSPEVAAILFADAAPAREGTRAELERIAEVDRAHVVMLHEVGLVRRPVAAALVGEIARLRAERFESVLAAPRPRGLYLAYEGQLVERLGMDTGGVLHTGRSRNDLGATVQRLRAREDCEAMARALLALVGTLAERAREHAATLMPAYTHYQVAMPITFGHYLLGVAWAGLRELRALLDAGAEADLSPLGAGAGGGTTLALDPDRTAELLGFAAALPNSVEAVASRAFVLRLLSACAQVGVLLSRVATDLLLWSTEEVGFVVLADDVVGSSSMMPQKRNPFVLEHVQGRGGAATGAFVAAAAAMAGTPFTNSVAVGTEATKALAPALAEMHDAIRLLQLVVAGLEPVPERMRERAVDGHAGATAVAEALVEAGVPFRRAHHEVGALVRRAYEDRRTRLDELSDLPAEIAAAVRASTPPERVLERGSARGGPSPQSLADALEAAGALREQLEREIDDRAARWARARALLDAACAALDDDG